MMYSKIIKVIVFITVMSLVTSCGKNGSFTKRLPLFFSKNMFDYKKHMSEFEAPKSDEALASSTNFSENLEDPRVKPKGFEGAAFIQPPQPNNYGAVSLAYPIEVAQGRAGMQPAVGLAYSSSGGDGLLGAGWSLGTGLGSISRSTDEGELYYDYRDTFTYNGKRLVKVSGSSTGENGEYRLEIETGFMRFELQNADRGGVWRVYDKSGTVTIYGNDHSQRIFRPDDPSRTYSWLFSRAEDLNGNFMEAAYDDSDYDEDHVLYLREIRYTGNSFMNTAARQYVRFHLKDRDDSFVSTAPGFTMRMNRLLDYIEVGWDDPEGRDNTALWRYDMMYAVSEDSGRPLLERIDSNRASTRPAFSYIKSEHGLFWRQVHNPDAADPDLNPDSVRYFEGDFNGDGISDMVYFNPSTGEWRAAEGFKRGESFEYHFRTYGIRFKGYDNESKIQFFKGNVSGDYNGDGRCDIAMYLTEEKEFWVAEHNGQGFTFRRYGTMPPIDLDIFTCEWFPGDFDGNGLSDSLLFNEPAGEWWLMKNMGGRFAFVKFSKHFKNLYRYDYSPDSALNSGHTRDRSDLGRDRGKIQFFTGDYNGDGRTDIALYDGRSGSWWVAENYRDKTAGFKLEWRLYKKFTAPDQALFCHDRFTGDFNGDGLSDVLIFNNATGEWILGETGDRTISFRVYSRTPQFREITRWLQGDFNGDGRTDIGFYSRSDNNFWIGEASPAGFRWRIYSTMDAGPDADRVMKTPLPMEEVVITEAEAVMSNEAGIAAVMYRYDGNRFADRGEIAFPGYFTGASGLTPEFLIYRRKDNALYYKKGDGTIGGSPVVSAIDLDGVDTRLLNNGRPGRYRAGDGILYYNLDSSFYQKTHSFTLVDYNNGFRKTSFAQFTGTQVADFDIDKSLYFIDAFNNGTENKYLLVLDDRADTPRFVRFIQYNAPQALTIGAGSDLTAADLKDLRSRMSGYRIFTGKFTGSAGDPAQVLVADVRSSVHVWYLGSISGNAVTFKRLSGNPLWQGGSDTARYHVRSGEHVYESEQNTRVRFHRISISGTSNQIYQTDFPYLDASVSFKGDYDASGNPIVRTSSGLKRAVLGAGSVALETPAVSYYEIGRPDLMEKYYPFQWVQGDYNGDGMTDIGIFSLKEGIWYYALSRGTVPDLLTEVRNGIGGTYAMEYINSTSLDNTGDDDIPDLPMNYRVCSRITVNDGRGASYSTRYDYAGGYAFCAFINGRKETDYFGFSEFTATDAAGGRVKNVYHTAPFDDFRKNRALAGAIKESRYFGSDSREYSRTEYEYILHEIVPAGFFPPAGLEEGLSRAASFLAEPAKIKKYAQNTLVSTAESAIELAPGRYELARSTAKATDHYRDAVHFETTVESYTEYTTIDSTNETRVTASVSLKGTPNETTTRFQYDGKGNVTEKRAVYTGSGLAPAADKVVSYQYDGYGNMTATIDSSGAPERRAEVIYDERLHQFPVEERAYKEQGYLSTRSVINYAKAFGSALERIDPNGNRTIMETDDLGRIVRVRADTDSGVRTLLESSYSADFPMSAKTVQYTGASGSDGIATRVFVDGLGREIHTVASALDIPGRRYVKSGLKLYDNAGRLVKMGQADWAGDDEIDEFAQNRKMKNPTATGYDPSGRVRSVTLPRASADEAETTISYEYNDPWEVAETHSIGQGKRTVTNARGQVLYVEDFGRGDDGQSINAKIGFAYSTAGQLIKKMDLNGASMSLSAPPFPSGNQPKDSSGNNIAYFWYDGFGRLSANNDPDKGLTRIQYNGFGNVISKTDAMGRATSFEYDRLGRVIEKLLPDNEGTVTYAYDSLAGSENSAGRLVAVNDPVQRVTLSYDRLGRTKREVRRFNIAADKFRMPGGMSGATEFETLFDHDLLGRTMKIHYPVEPATGRRAMVSYRYNAMGRVNGIDLDHGEGVKPIVSSIDYNEFGQMTQISRGNGVRTSYEYDVKGRLSRLVTVSGANGQDRKVQDVAYRFNTRNSIVSMEDRAEMDAAGANPAVTRYEYSYDGLNRLVRALGNHEKNTTAGPETRQFERAYAYAANGNLTRKEIIDPASHNVQERWNYAYSNHAAMTISTASGLRFEMQYDMVGNMVSKRDHVKGLAKTMQFDSANRVTAVVNSDNGNLMGSYFYDDSGFRAAKSAYVDNMADLERVDLLNASRYLSLEDRKDSSGNPIAGTYSAVNHIYLNGVRIAATTPGGGALYFLGDQVESVKATVDDRGLVTSRTEYLPYGETWFQEGDQQQTPKYNSQELDKESGLLFYNARHYDAEIGRFITADCVTDGAKDTQGWNRYSYTKGNPILYSDPTGHYIQIIIAVINFLKETGGLKCDFNPTPGMPQLDVRISKEAKIVYALVSAILSICNASGSIPNGPGSALATANNVMDKLGYAFDPIGKILRPGIERLDDLLKEKQGARAQSGSASKGPEIKSGKLKIINNEVKQYVNQMNANENPGGSCGPSMVASITGESIEDIKSFLKSRGKNYSYEPDLKWYLAKVKGYEVKEIVQAGSKDTMLINDNFLKIIEELDNGALILYHRGLMKGGDTGHYMLLKGYDMNTGEFIFYDPAGNYNKGGYFNNEGMDVRYHPDDLNNWKVRQHGSLSTVY